MNSIRLTMLPLGALVLFVLGQAFDGSMILKCVTELGAFGFLVWFCWYAVSRVLPTMQNSFRQETDAERMHNREIIAKLVERQEKDTATTSEAIRSLIRHCARQEHGKPKQD